MYTVGIYAAVGDFVSVQGNRRRQAARLFSVCRDMTAKMCAYWAPPAFWRQKSPAKTGSRPSLQNGNGMIFL